MNARQDIPTRGKRVLLGESLLPVREALVNQLLMAGAAEVTVAVNADELVSSLKNDGFDLLLLSQSIFAERPVFNELEILRQSCTSTILVLLEDEDESLAPQALDEILKGTSIYLCVLRSNVARMLKNILHG